MEETPNVREYVKIAGVWQHTEAAWYVDKDRLKAAGYEDYACIAHVHHWKTAIEEYCRLSEEWKCIRCGDELPENLKGMIKIYRPLKDV